MGCSLEPSAATLLHQGDWGQEQRLALAANAVSARRAQPVLLLPAGELCQHLIDRHPCTLGVGISSTPETQVLQELDERKWHAYAPDWIGFGFSECVCLDRDFEWLMHALRVHWRTLHLQAADE
jgi:pimeloyl-ACP methyl ester carboxylesterase